MPRTAQLEVKPLSGTMQSRELNFDRMNRIHRMKKGIGLRKNVSPFGDGSRMDNPSC
jgi:hypothetical protein